MNVSLTPELERRIAERLNAGLYVSPSAIVRESLRLLFRMEDEAAPPDGKSRPEHTTTA